MRDLCTKSNKQTKNQVLSKKNKKRKVIEEVYRVEDRDLERDMDEEGPRL